MIYDNSWNVPNGDPITGQQRFDNANQKIMVSDLRIKRFIRDKYIDLSSEPIYYKWDSIDAEKLLKNISGSALVFRKKLLEKGLISNIEIPDLKEFKKNNKDVSFLDIIRRSVIYSIYFR